MRITLSHRIAMGMALVLGIVALYWIFATRTLHEFERTHQALAADYEMALRTHRLREALVDYHYYGLMYLATRDDRDLANRDSSYAAIAADLQADLAQELDPSLRSRFTVLQARLHRLLTFYPGKATPFPEDGLFLDPYYSALYKQIFSTMVDIVDKTSLIASEERANASLFYQRQIALNAWLLVASLVFLLSLAVYAYRRFALPIQAMGAMLERIRAGDLSVRWHGRKRDELDEMGATLTDLAHELELRRSQRAAFIGSVAHDFGNPLQAIALSCELALRSASRLANDALVLPLVRMKKQLAHLKRLAGDLMRASNESVPAWDLHIRAFNLLDVAGQAVQLAEVSFPDHSFRLIAHHAPVLRADADRVHQVLVNLLMNGAKYSPPGTPVELVVGPAAGGSYFEVRDRGVGIEARDRELIFEPHARLTEGARLSGGAGLGLAIVRGIVLAHHGTVAVRARAGGGTVFRVEIPDAI